MRSWVIIAALAVLVPSPAHAAVPACSSLPNPIYLQVGDTQQNLMKRLGRALRDNTDKPLTLVWITSGSCTNIDNFYHHTAAITANMQYVPSHAEDPNWTPSSATIACTPDANTFPDIGNSALFISSCTQEAPPSGVTLTNGPTQAYVLAVPRASEANAITFEEAYFVFGFGPILLDQMQGAIAPWVDENQLFIRTTTKSTLLTWAANIAVAGDKWHGTRYDGSPMVVAALEGSTNPGAAIGILGAEVYDGDRVNLKELAFRAKNQYAAYYADSTATSRDKMNVRDGHYTVWSPTVWMTNDAGKADAKYVVDMIAGKLVTPAPNFDPNAIVANVGLVPDCAMRVQRDFDGGPLRLYKPSVSCTCKYEHDVDVSDCKLCDANTPCSSGTCRNGYCEEF